jgi:hypothetical protein
MDGGGSDWEEGLWNGQSKVSIRGSMKERGGMFFFSMQIFLLLQFSDN